MLRFMAGIGIGGMLGFCITTGSVVKLLICDNKEFSETLCEALDGCINRYFVSKEDVADVVERELAKRGL